MWDRELCATNRRRSTSESTMTCSVAATRRGAYQRRSTDLRVVEPVRLHRRSLPAEHGALGEPVPGRPASRQVRAAEHDHQHRPGHLHPDREAKVNAGGDLRFGWKLADDLGNRPLRPAGENAAPTSGGHPRGWFGRLLATTDAAWVIRDITLNDTTRSATATEWTSATCSPRTPTASR